MGQASLVVRLATRDLRRRPLEAVLLFSAIVAATTTLTLGLVVRDLGSNPYQSTRKETFGPDVVAIVGPSPGMTSPTGEPTDLSALEDLAAAPDVVDRTGPYPVTGAVLEADGFLDDVQAMGRDITAASVDQPLVIRGGWIRAGGAVVEAAYANALDLEVGDRILLNDEPFDVVGVGVTAASPPYPQVSCYVPCIVGLPPDERSRADVAPIAVQSRGLVWLTRADAIALAPASDFLSYVVNLKLDDPEQAREFVHEYRPAPPSTLRLEPWQDTLEQGSHLVRNARRMLLTGGWLLSLLSMATVAVLVGGRMAEQSRRVGLLKAVGGTPHLVAAVLLAEYVVVALLAGALGLTLGWQTAPLITEPSAGLMGASVSSLTAGTVGVVIGVALVVVVAATAFPAIRAARTSTILALADSARRPRRTDWMITISSRLPTSMLLALRTMARQPRRLLLNIAGVALAVSGVVAALAANTQLQTQTIAGSQAADTAEQLSEVLLVITLMLIGLAAVNALFIASATVLDERHNTAVTRAIGATPQQVSSGLLAAQLIPATIGAILGVPGGIALYVLVTPDSSPIPPIWQLLAVVVAAVLVLTLLTATPALAAARRPAVDTLRTELL